MVFAVLLVLSETAIKRRGVVLDAQAVSLSVVRPSPATGSLLGVPGMHPQTFRRGRQVPDGVPREAYYTVRFRTVGRQNGTSGRLENEVSCACSMLR